jgi:peptidoglycan/LPS O-acetylase OafA/YrhL
MPIPATDAAIGALPRDYRPDLDGLRALAVVPVVITHAGTTWLPGGFVGVDVFFVLSGFFITQQLLKDLDDQKFSLLRFYERRARRLLPALFVMLAAATMVATIFLVPDDLIGYAKSLASTLIFGSNFYFWRDTNYFAQAASLKPLLHTWSLAVEEQFYILFPLLLLALHKFARRAMLGVLLLGLLTSFALAVVAAKTSPAANFYLAPTRAWELLLGAALAIQAPKIAMPIILRHAVSLIGLTLIVGSMLLIDDHTPFPSWATLAPVGGAGLIVLASVAGGGYGNAILSVRPIVFVGLISYSLYLWHWPPLAFANYIAMRPLESHETIGWIAIGFVCAVLSWRFVERPFRGSKSKIGATALTGVVFGGSAALATGAAVLLLTAGLPGRFKPEALAYLTNEPEIIAENCFNRLAADVQARRLCVLGTNLKQPSVIVWGDSHAGRIGTAVDAILRRSDQSSWYAAIGGCPPLVDVIWSRTGCREFTEATIRLISQEKPSIIILAGLWSAYAEGTFYPTNRIWSPLSDTQTVSTSNDDNRRIFQKSLRSTVGKLRATGANVIVVGPIPEIGWSVPHRLALMAERGATPPTGPKLSDFQTRQQSVLVTFAELESMAGVFVIYPHQKLCDVESCMVQKNGVRLYFDDNHLALAGLGIIEPMIEEAITKAMQSKP